MVPRIAKVNKVATPMLRMPLYTIAATGKRSKLRQKIMTFEPHDAQGRQHTSA